MMTVQDTILQSTRPHVPGTLNHIINSFFRSPWVVIYRGGIFASLRCAREAKIPSLYITKKIFFLLQPLKFFWNICVVHVSIRCVTEQEMTSFPMPDVVVQETQEVNDGGWQQWRGLLFKRHTGSEWWRVTSEEGLVACTEGGVIRLSNWLMGTTSYTALWVKALHLWLFSK